MLNYLPIFQNQGSFKTCFISEMKSVTPHFFAHILTQVANYLNVHVVKLLTKYWLEIFHTNVLNMNTSLNKCRNSVAPGVLIDCIHRKWLSSYSGDFIRCQCPWRRWTQDYGLYQKAKRWDKQHSCIYKFLFLLDALNIGRIDTRDELSICER